MPSGKSPPSLFVALAAAQSSHPSRPMPIGPVASWSRIRSRPEWKIFTTPVATTVDATALRVVNQA
jgi:hypothetical protein